MGTPDHWNAEGRTPSAFRSPPIGDHPMPSRQPKNGQRAADEREERNTRVDEMMARAKRRLAKLNPLRASADKVKGGLANPPRKRP